MPTINTQNLIDAALDWAVAASAHAQAIISLPASKP